MSEQGDSGRDATTIGEAPRERPLRWRVGGAVLSLGAAALSASFFAWEEQEAPLEQLLPPLLSIALWLLYRRGGLLSRLSASLYALVAVLLALDLAYPPNEPVRGVPLLCAGALGLFTLITLSGRPDGRS